MQSCCKILQKLSIDLLDCQNWAIFKEVIVILAKEGFLRPQARIFLIVAFKARGYRSQCFHVAFISRSTVVLTNIFTPRATERYLLE